MTFIGHPDQKFGHVSYAQHGDDLMILNIFHLLGIKNPSYLDLGAHHPENISNTKLLYEMGSRGVNVEANPYLIRLFNVDRKEDQNVNLGVGVEPGDMEFYMYSDFSGRNTFSKEETESYGGRVQKKIVLPVKTINQIVDIYCDGKFPDLLSCDIEGLDFEVLSRADFSKSSPKVIVVETRRDETDAMISMIENKGYLVLCRMGENLFFIRQDFYNFVW